MTEITNTEYFLTGVCIMASATLSSAGNYTMTDHLSTAERMVNDIHDRAEQDKSTVSGEGLLKLAAVHVLIDIAKTLREIRGRS